MTNSSPSFFVNNETDRHLTGSPYIRANGTCPCRPTRTRLIHDDNDDGILYAAQLQGIIDNIAVDAREGYSFVYGEPMLIFKLMLNGACTTEVEGQAARKLTPCGTVTERIQFTAGGASHELVVQTEDEGATWTGAVDYLTQPMEIGDGARYVIEVGVRLSNIGASVGDSITDIFVKSETGDADGDSMPQGLTPDTPEVWVPVDYQRYNIGSYEIREPDYYAEWSLDEDIGMPELGQDETVTRTLTITNPTEVDQDYTAITTGTNGLHASVSDGATSGAALNFALQAGTSKEIEISAHNMATEAGASDWTVIIASSLGGYNTFTNIVHLEAPGCSTEGHGEHMDEGGMEGHEGMEHAADDCPPDHTLEEHHADGHGHDAEGHGDHPVETGDKETPFPSLFAVLALLGIVLRRK